MKKPCYINADAWYHWADTEWLRKPILSFQKNTARTTAKTLNVHLRKLPVTDPGILLFYGKKMQNSKLIFQLIGLLLPLLASRAFLAGSYLTITNCCLNEKSSGAHRVYTA